MDALLAGILVFAAVIVGAVVLIFMVFLGGIKMIALGAAVSQAERMTGRQWLKLILSVAIVAAILIMALVDSLERQARSIPPAPSRPSPTSTN